MLVVTRMPPFGESLYLVLYFLRNAIMDFPRNTLTNAIDKYSLEYLLNPIECLFLKKLLKLQTGKISKSKSCKQLGIESHEACAMTEEDKQLASCKAQ